MYVHGNKKLNLLIVVLLISIILDEKIFNFTKHKFTMQNFIRYLNKY